MNSHWIPDLNGCNFCFAQVQKTNHSSVSALVSCCQCCVHSIHPDEITQVIFKVLIYTGKIVCDMQERRLMVNELLSTNSHRCSWRGLYVSTPLSELGLLRGDQYRQTLRRTGKRNAYSQSRSFATTAFIPIRAVRLDAPCLCGTHCSFSALAAWAGAAVWGTLDSHCRCCTQAPHSLRSIQKVFLVSGWKRGWFQPVLTK